MMLSDVPQANIAQFRTRGKGIDIVIVECYVAHCTFFRLWHEVFPLQCKPCFLYMIHFYLI